MRNTRRVRMVALVGALSIVAAACGGDDGGEPSQPTLAPPNSTIVATKVHGLKMTVGTVVLFDKAWIG